LALGAVFVDVFHPISSEIKPEPQVARPQHVVQIGHGGDILSGDTLIERI
jgi:hypothetical protein